MPRLLSLLAGGTSVVLAAAPALALTLDFESFDHGDVVANRVASHAASHADWTLVVDNPNRDFDIAAAFDSSLSGTADPDLEMGGGWSGGNLAPDTDLGSMLILQERSCSGATCATPDDEGSRPAGSFLFLFEETFQFASIDLIDVELGEEASPSEPHGLWHKRHVGPKWGREYGREHGLFHKMNAPFGRGKGGGSEGGEDGAIRFFNVVDGEVDVLVAEYTFQELAALYPDLEFGNNTANRIDFGEIGDFNAVEVDLGGSGAIDNLVVVPEPATVGLVSLGLVGLGVVGRRRRPRV